MTDLISRKEVLNRLEIILSNHQLNIAEYKLGLSQRPTALMLEDYVKELYKQESDGIVNELVNILACRQYPLTEHEIKRLKDLAARL